MNTKNFLAGLMAVAFFAMTAVATVSVDSDQTDTSFVKKSKKKSA